MTLRPTVAFVLAAGLGQRMRPLTAERPKPLVPLAGKPLIDHVLDRLAENGIERVIVNLHYLSAKLEAHLKPRVRPQIELSHERERLLDTGGGISKVLDRLGAQPFLVHNSDSVWIEGMGSNLERLFAAWDDEDMDCLLMLAPVISSVGYDGLGDFGMDPEGRVARRAEGGVAPFAFSGVSLCHPRIFDGSPDGAFSLNVLWDRLIESKRLFGLRMEGIWMHVGTPESVKAAERCLETGTLD
jgi:MurNAc alpha-1-phosphate uridylyltransferase